MQVESTYDGVNRRKSVAMSSETVEDFLQNGPLAMTLGTLGVDGSIHLVTVSKAYVDGAIWVKSKLKAQKTVNLRRHPFASCMMSEDDDDYRTMHGLSASGPVTIFEDRETVMRITEHITARYAARGTAVADAAAVSRLSDGYVAIRFDNPRIRSWDHRNLTA